MGVLWIGCLCMLQAPSESARAGVPVELMDAEVRAVEFDADGTLWVVTRENGLARIDGEGLQWVSSGALPRGIADLAAIDQVLWAVGLEGTGRLGADGWTAVDVPNQPRLVFGAVGGGPVGGIWLGTSVGAAHGSERGWTTMSESDGLPHAVVHQVLVEPGGDVWFLCRRGVARLRGGSLEVFRTDLNFRAGLVGPDGHPWFGTSGGLQRWTGSEFQSELAGVVPYPKLVASDGTVWAGSASDGVLRYRDGVWSRPLPELDGHEVFDVAEGPDGAIWIGTSVGLRRLVVGDSPGPARESSGSPVPPNGAADSALR